MLPDISTTRSFAQTLPHGDWTRQMEDHKKTLSHLLDPYLEKRSRQEKDPVLDFLFEYFPFRPSHLMRWSPGIGTGLEVENSSVLPELSELAVEKGTSFLNR
jgi:hypothetical protein